jgi:ribosomal-protein-alanine N-acetyltransferase
MMLIRNFAPGDLTPVYDIESKSFPDPYDALFLLNLYQMYPETFFVAEVDGLVVAYVISRSVRDRGHIMAIAVDPPFRGRGIGTALMERTMMKMKEMNLKGIWLEVRVSNTRARAFYRKLGFTEKRILPGYYSDHEDAVVLEMVFF